MILPVKCRSAAIRIPKDFEARCLATHPDIIVQQFVTSDLVVPVRRFRRDDGSISAAHWSTSAKPSTRSGRLKWFVQGFIGDALKLPPVSPPEVYLENMNLLTRMLLKHQMIPGVLSPFVFGGQRSDRVARDCAGRLQQTVAALPDAVYVDAFAALNQYPRRRMLLGDGTHLSLEGHKVVGDVLFFWLKNVLENQAWIPKPLRRAGNNAPSPAFKLAPGRFSRILVLPSHGSVFPPS